MSCPKGMIERAGYSAVRSATNKAYRVKPACIRDVGKPGKTPESQRILTNDDLDLGVYGYKDIVNMKAEARHNALEKAIKGVMVSEKVDKHDAAVKVMRRLNYLYVLNRNTQVTVGKLLERDRNWVGRVYLGKDYTA